MTCLFCNVSSARVISENELAYAVRDGFPVTELHTLIIPKRHVEGYFGLTKEEFSKTLEENIYSELNLLN